MSRVSRACTCPRPLPLTPDTFFFLFRLSRVQSELLHTPVRDLADEQLVFVAAIDLMHRPELLQLLAGLAEFAEDFPVKLHLVDLACVIEIARAVRVRAIEVLMGARRNADRPRRPDVQERALQVAVVVEDLNTAIA